MNILTYYRKKAGLTQTELAAKTGIPHPNIAHQLHGHRHPEHTHSPPWQEGEGQ